MSLQPPSVLLMGTPGSGKTYSISTLLEAGLEVFLVSTEPHGTETLLDVVAQKNLPLNKLHWSYISPTRPGLDSLEAMAKLISISNQAALAQLNPTIRTNPSFVKLMALLKDFKDDKDGKTYGNVNQFNDTQVLVIDSLSGLSSMAMDTTIGDKVTANPGEWGIAMRLLDKFLLSMTSDLACFFALIAHVEPETNEVTQARELMVSTLGKKLAPNIPKNFSEVIYATTQSEGNTRKYFWSNNTPGVYSKHHALALGTTLAPTFVPIVSAYKARMAHVARQKVA